MLAAVVAAIALVAPPATIPVSAGWHVGSTKLEDAGCAKCIQTETWASTVPYADGPNELPPHLTAAKLGPAGIIIHVTRSWEPSPPAWMMKRHSLRIVRSNVTPNFEGNTTKGRVSRWTGSTWHNGSYVSVWVIFGSASPTRSAVARAQAKLNTIRFPLWSTGP